MQPLLLPALYAGRVKRCVATQQAISDKHSIFSAQLGYPCGR